MTVKDELVRKVAEAIALATGMDGDEADILYCKEAAQNAIAIVLAAIEPTANAKNNGQRNSVTGRRKSSHVQAVAS